MNNTRSKRPRRRVLGSIVSRVTDGLLQAGPFRNDPPQVATRQIGGFRRKAGSLGEPTTRRDTRPYTSLSIIRRAPEKSFNCALQQWSEELSHLNNAVSTSWNLVQRRTKGSNELACYRIRGSTALNNAVTRRDHLRWLISGVLSYHRSMGEVQYN